ncbi:MULTISPECIES: hypothetical protein [Actinomycetes]|uniref:Excreted virulence factor EspC (Type VII ESX diderm) n=2 Tax=Nocardia TaxID=1817 RepID=A0A4R6PV01_NOCIG|nr:MULTISPECIES: hypothetical protein [Nocardia]NKX88562.1 hypothetical protein [Nocardia coubleae]TDP42412.1 hypothetical protein DFR75_1011523 [Nocardia ignorata]
MAELYVDQNALETISRTLANSSVELDGTSDKVPASFDAGTVTPSALAILSVLLESAGNLVLGMGASATAVTEAATKYKEQDDTTADAILRENWKVV